MAEIARRVGMSYNGVRYWRDKLRGIKHYQSRVRRPAGALTVREAARRCHVSMAKVYLDIRRGTLRAPRQGKRLWLSWLDLENYYNNLYTVRSAREMMARLFAYRGGPET